MRNAVWNRPTGWGINLPILFISRQITAAHPDSLFTATLDGVTLRDFTWDVTAAPGPSGGGPGGKWPNGCVNGGADCTERPSGYLPITRGIRTHVRDVTLLTSVCVNDSKTMNEDGFCQHGSKVTLSVLQIRPGRRNLLRTGIDSGAGRNGVDVAAATVPLDPKSCADAGGWKV